MVIALPTESQRLYRENGLKTTLDCAALEVEAQQPACFLQYCYMSNVTEYVSGSPETTELRKTSENQRKHFLFNKRSYYLPSKVSFVRIYFYE